MSLPCLCVFSWNIRGLNNVVKCKQIALTLAWSGADIIILQETHLKHTDSPTIKAAKYKLQFLAAGSSKARGGRNSIFFGITF